MPMLLSGPAELAGAGGCSLQTPSSLGGASTLSRVRPHERPEPAEFRPSPARLQRRDGRDGLLWGYWPKRRTPLGKPGWPKLSFTCCCGRCWNISPARVQVRDRRTGWRPRPSRCTDSSNWWFTRTKLVVYHLKLVVYQNQTGAEALIKHETTLINNQRLKCHLVGHISTEQHV